MAKKKKTYESILFGNSFKIICFFFQHFWLILQPFSYVKNLYPKFDTIDKKKKPLRNLILSFHKDEFLSSAKKLVLQLLNCNPGLSFHRYSLIFSADSEIFLFSAMFRAVPADLNFDISGHNWFSDEHCWTSLIHRWSLVASSKQAKTIKTAKKDVFYY